MAWNTVLVERLQYILNEVGLATPTYTSGTLEKFIAIAATFASTDLSEYETQISGPYTINTAISGSGMIIPDPVDNGAIGFQNLILAKAACLIAGAELKLLGATAGWKITDDKSTIDGTNAIGIAKDNQSTYCDFYNRLLEEFCKGNQGAGTAILSPYSSSNLARGYPVGFIGWGNYR